MRNLCILSVGLALFLGTAAAQPGYNIKLTVSSQTACTNAPVLSLATDAAVGVNAGAGGSVTGRITITDFSLTRVSDDCSIALFRALFMVTRLPTVTISAFTGATEVLRFTLTNAIVTGIAESEPTGAPPAEKVTFIFDRIEILDVVTNHSVGYDRRSGIVLP
ncbi:MAG: type VI secretion system tube protein Hcp [Acidobacteriia bacterium]|nr:type VI secretion system tube protein Hcp [Terriglobia bacterium]